MLEQDNATPHAHALIQQWCRDHFTAFIYKDHRSPNRLDLNPLDYYILDEFVDYINWNNVRSKAALIHELKHSAKKNDRFEVAFESCSDWTNQLYRLKENDFRLFRLKNTSFCREIHKELNEKK